MPHLQFTITPWKDPQELVEVKDELYGGDDRRRQHACHLVEAWAVRGNVPHAVLSTAALAQATLDDSDKTSVQARGSAYMAAWIRFVTGMTDMEQVGRQKRSMYDVARDLRMPPSFVELRHRCSHETRPQLHTMQKAARQGLAWLHEYFWAHVGEPEHAADTEADEQSD